VKLTIVTPSFRSNNWLKLCIESVADQSGHSIEHIIQDSCSDDGTQIWLPREGRVKSFIEKDTGMYDGINRGLRRGNGEIFGCLNSDEQYLPGALASVARCFELNPAIDILIADTIVVDSSGKFVCCRKSLKPWKNIVWLEIPTITSSVFFHRRVLEKHDMFFDENWRDIADAFWMIKAVEKRLNMFVLRHYTSTFTDTGTNMNLQDYALQERRRKKQMAPKLIRRFNYAFTQLHRMRRLFTRNYWERSNLHYSIFTQNSQKQRQAFETKNPTCIWRSRHALANV